ncbi:hypothetical protein ACL6C3_21750 [Capilliphycus salinus ALCB114379]|uniref:hypothetical protein n=1 Tax=Capilliphycus salinus TaxID=2768948 RepID=UPI0039A622F1
MKTVMEQECRPLSDCIHLSNLFNGAMEWNSPEELIVSPQSQKEHLGTVKIPSGQRIRLALEQLQCFEVVEEQFLAWGISFVNAIALQPSNPAFGIQPNQTVVMAAPKSGWLEVHFQQPVRRVQAVVTSSRRTILSAYNQDGHEINRTEMASFDRASLPKVLPSDQLIVQGTNIHKVTFYTFDGQLIVDQFQIEF